MDKKEFGGMDNRTIFIQAALARDFGLMKKMLDKTHARPAKNDTSPEEMIDF